MQRYTMTEIVNHSRSTSAEHLTGMVSKILLREEGLNRFYVELQRRTAAKKPPERSAKQVLEEVEGKEDLNGFTGPNPRP